MNIVLQLTRWTDPDFTWYVNITSIKMQPPFGPASTSKSRTNSKVVGMLSGFPLLSRICGHTFVADFVPNSPVIVDLGMNEGSFTRGIRNQFPAARVFGCEPVPDLFRDL